MNFSLVWILLGIFSLIIFVYKISFFSSFSGKEQLSAEDLEEINGEGKEQRYFPAFSFVVIVISLLFLMSGQFIGGFLPSRLGLSNIEVGPSFSATMSVAKGSLMKDPVLGAGPNKFASVWAMYKPEVINLTQFWDTSFGFGSGMLPTILSTTGILGILSWLIFFALFLIAGARSIFSSIKSNANYETVIFFVASLYLFTASFFYSVGGVIFLLAFAFTGIFIGLFYSSYKEGELSFSFLNDPRKSFFSIFLLVVLMIVSIASSFKYMERLISVSYFGKTFSAPTISVAENNITKAIVLYQNDLYLRTYAQVYLTKLDSIVAKGSSLSPEDKTELQSSIDKAVSGAQLAVAYDKTNYSNWNSLAVTYNTVGLLGVKDVYDKAIEAFKQASVLNPLNPGIKLNTARVFLAQEKTKEAKDFAKQALALKSDYIDALIILAEIEKKEGNMSEAVSYAETALFLVPDNKDLIKYVDSLKNGSSVAAPSPLVVPSDSKDTKNKDNN